MLLIKAIFTHKYIPVSRYWINCVTFPATVSVLDHEQFVKSYHVRKSKNRKT